MPPSSITSSPVVPILLVSLIASTQSLASSDPVDQLLSDYQSQGATNFSAKRGQSLWQLEIKGRSCITCHSDDPKNTGIHQKTHKTIAPLAPSTNAKRLTKVKTIRKWLKRNCKWTLGRECTVQEKGDFLTWMRQK